MLIFIRLLSPIPSLSAENILMPGEYLEYEVSYLGIKLGKIKTKVEGFETINNEKVAKINASAYSYSGIPFVDLQVKMTALMDYNLFFSHKYEETRKVGENSWEFQQISFDYSRGQIDNKIWRDKKLIETSTMFTRRKCYDGLAMLFFARQFSYLRKNTAVFNVIFSDTAWTSIYFLNKKESVSIDAVQYPVKTVYFEGQAHWKGIYGLSGKFRGWMSDDDARIPIVAKLNVYLGSVKVELVRWRRAGWKPPQG